MEKTILASVRILALVVIVLVIMSSNQIYNQKIIALKTDQIIDTIDKKSFAVRCVPSSIVIDQKTETIITSLDCDKGSAFIQSGFDSGVHFVTGDYSVWTGKTPSFDKK